MLRVVQSGCPSLAVFELGPGPKTGLNRSKRRFRRVIRNPDRTLFEPMLRSPVSRPLQCLSPLGHGARILARPDLPASRKLACGNPHDPPVLPHDDWIAALPVLLDGPCDGDFEGSFRLPHEWRDPSSRSSDSSFHRHLEPRWMLRNCGSSTATTSPPIAPAMGRGWLPELSKRSQESTRD